MSKTHELKTWPELFEAVLEGRKPFEVRRDDRGFSVDDVLLLREYEPAKGEYTGRIIAARVLYMLRNFQGIAPGFVVMSTEIVSIIV